MEPLRSKQLSNTDQMPFDHRLYIVFIQSVPFVMLNIEKLETVRDIAKLI